MKRFIHYTIGIIALPFLPLFWMMFNCLGVRITVKEFLHEWVEQMKSTEPWGGFDGG